MKLGLGFAKEMHDTHSPEAMTFSRPVPGPRRIRAEFAKNMRVERAGDKPLHPSEPSPSNRP